MALYYSNKTIIIIKKGNIKHNGHFCCLICFHLLRTEKRLKSHKKVCINKNICSGRVPSEENMLLMFTQYKEISLGTIYDLCRS